MLTKALIPFFIGLCIALLPLVLTQLECQANVQNHIENVVDQVIADKTKIGQI